MVIFSSYVSLSTFWYGYYQHFYNYLPTRGYHDHDGQINTDKQRFPVLKNIPRASVSLFDVSAPERWIVLVRRWMLWKSYEIIHVSYIYNTYIITYHIYIIRVCMYHIHIIFISYHHISSSYIHQREKDDSDICLDVWFEASQLLVQSSFWSKNAEPSLDWTIRRSSLISLTVAVLEPRPFLSASEKTRFFTPSANCLSKLPLKESSASILPSW